MTASPLPPRALQVALLAALVALAPAAAAQVVTGQAVAREVNIDGNGGFDGSFGLLHTSASDGSGAGLGLVVRGASIVATQQDDEGYEVAAPTPGAPTAVNTLRLERSLQGQAPAEHKRTSAVLTLTGAQDDFILHGFVASGSPLVAGTVTDARSTVVQEPFLDHTLGIIETAASPSEGLTTGPGDGYWSFPASSTAHVRVTANAVSGLAVRGDFVLEVMGLQMMLRGSEGDVELRSGSWVEPVDPSQPAATQGAAYRLRQSFLRIEVTAGELVLDVPGADLLQFSGTEHSAQASGVQLVGATGLLTSVDGTQERLTGSTYRIDGPSRIDMNPSDGGVQLVATGLDAQGNPLAPSTSQAQLPGPVVMVGASAVALAAVVALAVAIGRRRHDTMADVEARLEAGHYRAAARAAGRILARRPGSEDALLSRAIALSKSGRPGAVVAELGAHLRSRDPTDGTLHYVLGLAFLDLGRQAEARTALREAVRRTPSLAAQAAPHLASDTSGQQGSRPASGMLPGADPHGYA